MTSASSLFGSLSLDSGSPKLFGTNSKLDIEALVQSAYEAKRLPAVRLETKISDNETRIQATNELKGLLGDIKGALAGLRNPPGFNGSKENLFETKEAFLTSSTATDPSTLVGASVDSTAQTGSFDLKISQLAAAEKRATASADSLSQSLADAWNNGNTFSGTITIGLQGGDSRDIAVDGTMTLEDLKDAVNAESSTTGISASLLKVSDGDHRLVLTATETGKAIELNDMSGIQGGFQTDTLQAAQKAEFTVDGVAITRDGNEVDDLVPGVTLNLFKAEPGTEVTVEVEPALAEIKEGIQGFVDAYNAFRDFALKHQDVDSTGEVADDAVLFGDRNLRSVAQTLSRELGISVDGLDAGVPDTLAALGISLGADNKLEIDDGKLDNALLTDLEGVRGVFEFNFEASSPELRVFDRTNALADTEFTVDITDADADGVPEGVTIDGVAAVIDGSTIKGADGTAYEGLELLWVGEGSQSIDVKATQGVADRVYNSLSEELDPNAGAIARTLEDLEDRNGRHERQIERIEDRALTHRDRLIEKFTAMEAALSTANAAIEQIRAQVDAWSSNS